MYMCIERERETLLCIIVNIKCYYDIIHQEPPSRGRTARCSRGRTASRRSPGGRAARPWTARSVYGMDV